MAGFFVLLSAAPARAAELNFACAIPRCNIQYVAGGEVGAAGKPNPMLDYNTYCGTVASAS